MLAEFCVLWDLLNSKEATLRSDVPDKKLWKLSNVGSYYTSSAYKMRFWEERPPFSPRVLGSMGSTTMRHGHQLKNNLRQAQKEKIMMQYINFSYKNYSVGIYDLTASFCSP